MTNSDETEVKNLIDKIRNEKIMDNQNDKFYYQRFKIKERHYKVR